PPLLSTLSLHDALPIFSSHLGGHSLSSSSRHGQDRLVVRMGQTSTPQTNKFFCGVVLFGRWACAPCYRRFRAFLAALSASVVTWDQEEHMSAQIEIVATGRCTPAHYLSSIIDVVWFY